MHLLNITVENKKAWLSTPAEIVCDNSDYVIEFTFDSEWDAYPYKTARFFYNSKYDEVVFEGNTCPVPVISKATGVFIGIFAGDIATTTPAYVPCVKSILCLGGEHADPPEDVYNQIMELINNLQVDKGVPSDSLPLIDGEASPGESKKYSRADHVHPTDTSRASAQEFDRFKEETNKALDEKQGNLEFEGEYNAESNKVATESTVSSAVKSEEDRAKGEEKTISDKLSVVESIAKGASQVKSYPSYKSMIDELNTLEADALLKGQDVYIATKGVPDFWIYDISTTSEPFDEYVDEETFAKRFEKYTFVKVGYYVLTTLETLKPNLEDYAKKDTVPTSLHQLTEDDTHRVVTDAEKQAWNAKSNFSGSYNDLTNLPTIPTVPTKVSEFENDANYVKNTDIVDNLESTDTQKPLSAKQGKVLDEKIGNVAKEVKDEILPKFDDKQDTVAFDGDYNAETNKAATVKTVTDKVAEIVANAPEDFDTLKELAVWLETHGKKAAEMNSDIEDLKESKQDNLVFDGEYNAETNPVATKASIPTKVSEIDNDEGYIKTPSPNVGESVLFNTGTGGGNVNKFATASADNGLAIYSPTGSNPMLGVNPATRDQIKGRKYERKPICTTHLDYAIKVGLTDNKEASTWTDDEKSEARKLIGAASDSETSKVLVADDYEALINQMRGWEIGQYKVGQYIHICDSEVPDLCISYVEYTKDESYEYTTNEHFIQEIKDKGELKIGYYSVQMLNGDVSECVKKTDIAESSKAGVVRVPQDATREIYRNNDGMILLGNANKKIDSKSGREAIRNQDLDYAIKVGLTTNTQTLTDEEKANAQKWLGIDNISGGNFLDVSGEVTSSSESTTGVLDGYSTIFYKVSDQLPKSLVGATVKYTHEDASGTISDCTHTIAESETTLIADGITNIEYTRIFGTLYAFLVEDRAIVHFDTSPVSFPSAGVYIGNYDGISGTQFESIEYSILLDNKYLDLPNNEDFKQFKAKHDDDIATVRESIVQADYLENDSTSPSYIKNRQFYDISEDIHGEVTDESEVVSVYENDYLEHLRLYKVSDATTMPEDIIGGVVGGWSEEFYTSSGGGNNSNTEISHTISESDTIETGEGGYYVKLTATSSRYVYVVTNYEAYSASTGIPFTSNGVYLSRYYFEGAVVTTTQLTSIDFRSVLDRKLLDNKYLDLPNNEAFLQLSDKVNEVESIAKGAYHAVSYANYGDMVADLKLLPADAFSIGQSIYIVDADSTDLWVSGIRAVSYNYNYVSDEVFVTHLEETNAVDVGYFTLSKLNTDKVDLTNYPTNDDVANKYLAKSEASLYAVQDKLVKRNTYGNIMLPEAKYIPDKSDNAASVNKVLQMLSPLSTIMGKKFDSTSICTITAYERGLFIVTGANTYVTYNGTAHLGNFHIFVIHDIQSTAGNSKIMQYINHIYINGGAINLASEKITTPYDELIKIMCDSGEFCVTKMPMINVDWQDIVNNL